MAWQSRSRYMPFSNIRNRPMLESFNVNDQCFIRKEHECGKIFGASKSCFIACPTDDELEPILELMSEKLTKVGIEPIVAVKERAYGQDIFCTKICGKIIESRFCIVILDDTTMKEHKIPNPNVYYEYGLMTSLKKQIIPLQKEDLELAFNIQSYDTIKYSPKNIAIELERAIRDAIKLTEAQDKQPISIFPQDKGILRKFELAGFQEKDEKWVLSNVIDDTNFRGFGHHQKGFYVYLGKIDTLNDMADYLEDISVVLYRTENKAIELEHRMSELIEKKKASDLEKEKTPAETFPISSLMFMRSNAEDFEKQIDDTKSKLSLMYKLYIGFIMNPQLNANEFKRSCETISKQYSRYEFVFSASGEIRFGDIIISLSGFDSSSQ